jgi:Kdo2-lipid IVA lauroyltransferase/acyltransferase
VEIALLDKISNAARSRRDHLTTLTLRTACSALNICPIERVSAAGGWFAKAFGPGTKRHERAMRNIGRAFPHTAPERREEIAAEMWDNFGRTIAESFIIRRIADDHGRISVANPEILETTGFSRQGIVFVGLHFGNWEISAIPGLERRLELAALYKPSKNLGFNTWLLEQRRSFYPGGLLAAGPNSLLKLARVVRRGGAVCVLADHRDPNGVHVEFLNAAAPSMRLPAFLAVRYRSKLIAARVDRLANANFSIYLTEIAVPDTGRESEDVGVATANVQNTFAQWIIADPGKWLWFYNRWSNAD